MRFAELLFGLTELLFGLIKLSSELLFSSLYLSKTSLNGSINIQTILGCFLRGISAPSFPAW